MLNVSRTEGDDQNARATGLITIMFAREGVCEGNSLFEVLTGENGIAASRM